MTESKTAARSPWFWVPSLYFAEGMPYVVVMSVSVILYKRLGISNTDIALYTSWLYLPWVIKPLWSPFMELFRTKRFFIVATQLLTGAALAAVALTLPGPAVFQASLAVFWLMAFSSATHDIAADGFYMLGLEPHRQAAFVGIRSAFYRLAMIGGQGALVMFAGKLEASRGIPAAWSAAFFVLAGLFLALGLWHLFVLPRPDADRPDPAVRERGTLREFFLIFGRFFARRDLLAVLAFLLFYRFAEAQLVKMVAPFLLDARADGGLGLSTGQVGFAYGTIGIGGLVLGGVLGGLAIAWKGLRYWLWPMVLILHLPDLVFVYLAYAQPQSFPLATALVAIEQFGYAFGLTAYTMFMIHTAQGEHKTAHYALCTGIMALGMMLPGMWSGQLQEWLGYRHFFLWVVLSTLPGFAVVVFVKIPEGFGKKAAV